MSKDMNVLIVDDEPAVCDLLDKELSEHGCVCTKAFNGNEALSRVIEHNFQVVVLDIRLPGTSGMDVLREIRLRYPSTYVIMITAINDLDTAVDAMKLGASDYFVKPFDLSQVARNLICLLNKSTAQEYADEMDAIALGMDRAQEVFNCHSEFVIEAVGEVARRLGIPKREILRWKADRRKCTSERRRLLGMVANKLRQNPAGQTLMGLSAPHLCNGMVDEQQN